MVVLLSNRLDRWVNCAPKIRKMLKKFKHISWHKKPAWHLPRHATGKERTYEKEIDLLDAEPDADVGSRLWRSAGGRFPEEEKRDRTIRTE